MSARPGGWRGLRRRALNTRNGLPDRQMPPRRERWMTPTAWFLIGVFLALAYGLYG